MVVIEDRIDRIGLEWAQRCPAEGVDDMMLQRRVQPVERTPVPAVQLRSTNVWKSGPEKGTYRSGQGALSRQSNRM